MAQRWLARSAAVAFAVALLAGCGSGSPASTPTPTAAPSATPAATPSPTPDPVALALAGFAAKDLRCHYTNDGTATIGTTVVTQVGEGNVDGDSEAGTYETKVGGTVVEAKETLAIGPKEWERVAGGPWHDRTPTNGPFVDALAGLTALTVVGQETLDGAAVLHVRPASGVMLDPKRWGPTESAVTGLTIALDLWIHPDGTLAKMVREAKWTQASGATALKVQATTTTTCSALGAGFIAISAPSDPWVAYTSTAQGYTISQPEGYQAVTDEGGDSFVYGEQAALTVGSSEVDSTLDLDGYLQALTKTYTDQVKASLLDAYDASIDGHTAKIAVYKAKSGSGADIRLADAIVLVNGRAWEIYIVGTPDTLASDLDYLKQSLTTMEFKA